MDETHQLLGQLDRKTEGVGHKLNALDSKTDGLDLKHVRTHEMLQFLNLKLNDLDSRLNSLDVNVAEVRAGTAPLLQQMTRLLVECPYEEPEATSRTRPPVPGLVNLNEYKSNGRFSQGGEEGILTELYGYIEPTGFVIEFGAANGPFCSNTAHLWIQGKAEALLIESDDELFSELEENTKSHPNVTIEHALVENIDDHTRRPADILSIDIDGYDYDIAEKMKVEHQIVVIEYNPTVPPHVDMLPTRPLQGASAKSLVTLMRSKGYTLVACTKTNLFFLLGDHKDKFESRLEVLFDYSSLNYAVTTFDGQYQMVGEFGFGFERPADLKLLGRESDTCFTSGRVEKVSTV